MAGPILFENKEVAKSAAEFIKNLPVSNDKIKPQPLQMVVQELFDIILYRNN